MADVSGASRRSSGRITPTAPGVPAPPRWSRGRCAAAAGRRICANLFHRARSRAIHIHNWTPTIPTSPSILPCKAGCQSAPDGERRVAPSRPRVCKDQSGRYSAEWALAVVAARGDDL